MAQALASRPWRANAVSLSKVMDERRRGSSRRKTAISTATVSAADLPASLAASTVDRGAINGLALLQHQHGSGPPADQQVAFPVTGVPAFQDGLGPVVDGAAFRDDVAGLASPPPAAPGAP